MISQSSEIQPRKKIKIGDDDAKHDDLEVAGKQSYHQEIKFDRAAEIPSSNNVDTTLSLVVAVPEDINTYRHHHHHHHRAVMMINLAKFRNEIIDESSNFLGLGIINDCSRNYEKDDSDDHKSRVEIKIGDDDAKHDDLEVTACHDFLKEAHEDILLEIFIRLPDSRSAIRTGIVCHNWHSLISHNPRFISRFISHHHQHQHRYPLPYTLILRKAEKNIEFASPQYFQPIFKLFSEESTFCTSPNFLDFLPSSPMVIRVSCNDLLLVSPDSRWSTDFYICNPITKQFIQLPEILRPYGRNTGVIGHALVCMPGGPTNKFRFKVVEFKHPFYPNRNSELPRNTLHPITVFCSESRKWEMRFFLCPTRARKFYPICWLPAVACNGILYWLEYEYCGVDRVISLDLSLSNSQCGVIDFPDDSSYDPLYVRRQIGGVRVCGGEELRLLQVFFSMESTVDLKVWKLSYNSDNQDKKKDWVLVHHKSKLKMPNKRYDARPLVHPTNGDVVFIVWGTNDVYQYNLKDDTTCEMIGKLQEPLASTRWLRTTDLLLPFPVVHQNWPTQILT